MMTYSALRSIEMWSNLFSNDAHSHESIIVTVVGAMKHILTIYANKTVAANRNEKINYFKNHELVICKTKQLHEYRILKNTFSKIYCLERSAQYANGKLLNAWAYRQTAYTKPSTYWIYTTSIKKPRKDQEYRIDRLQVLNSMTWDHEGGNYVQAPIRKSMCSHDKERYQLNSMLIKQVDKLKP